ncbi:MAG: thioredoxin domain-containing protein [Gemmatirosa sp.]|nr:thioredoxin domain-containing protein [Gemmatirosa sp.]
MRFAISPRTAPSLALLLLATATACRSSGEAKTTSTPPAAVAAPGAPSAAGGETVPVGGTMPADSTALRAAADAGRIDGAPTAKLWMIVASDFQCPYCKIWHDQTYEALRKEYVETGKMRIAYLNFPLGQHAQAMPAAEAAMCASAQGHFWPYHTALFNTQAQWEKPGDPAPTFDSLATATGLDLGRFRSCTQSHVMRALIAADQDRMQSRGVQSTPSFFVGNQAIAGALPAADFRKAIDASLAQTR